MRHHARREDLPYVTCQVCQLLAKNAWQQVDALRRAASPSKPLEETAVIECMEKITTAWRPQGEWIAKLDLVEEGDKLAVKEMGQVGNCGVECKTVQLAAQRIMGEHDTDAAEVLFVNKMSAAQFERWLCWDESLACTKDPPPLSKQRQPGPPFDPRKEGDQNIDAMLGSLEEQGVSHKKIRDELLEKMGAGGSDAGRVPLPWSDEL